MVSEVDEYIETLRRLTGATTDAELAERLGVAKQTISSWRRRGSVPAKSQQAFAAQLGPEAIVDPALRYWKESREWQLVLAVMLATFDINRPSRRTLDFGEYVKWGEALSHSEEAIRAALRKLQSAAGKDDPAALAEMMLVMIRAGKVPELQHAIDIWVRDKFGIEGPH